MELIAHRGNTDGPKPHLENSPDYIDSALSQGFKAEIDLWMIHKGLFLGHDEPTFHIELKYLVDRSEHLYVHLKNYPKKDWRLPTDLETFVHDQETYVLTSKNTKWYFPSTTIYVDGVNLMPEFNYDVQILSQDSFRHLSVCSDYVKMLIEGAAK
jgi:hypothetical protein